MRAARCAGQPNVKDLPTSQRMVSFYMTWFTRIFVPTEAGWIIGQTPDGLPLCEQDAFFWLAVETIAREFNCMRAEQMAEMTKV